MKWYKHDADASTDAKIKKLILKHGAEGYAVYFHCLELIVGDLEENHVTFELEHDSEIIADNLKIKPEQGISSIDKVNNILRTIIDLELFQENNDRVFCFKLAKRLDLSITRNIEVKKIVKQMKENLVPYSQMTVPNRLEENRVDKNRKEKNKKNDDIDIPEYINIESFNEFIEHRKLIKKPMTRLTIKKNIQFLKYYTKDDQSKIIDNSIVNGYQGLFNNEKIENVKDYLCVKLYPYNKRYLMEKYETEIIFNAIREIENDNNKSILEGNKAVDMIESKIMDKK